MRPAHIVTVALVVMTGAARGAAQPVRSTVHVAPGGDDSASGSRTAPLRTINAAIARLRPGQTARIASGVYRETLASVRSGTPSAPIRIEAAVGATVIVTATEQVTGWRHAGGCRYQAAVGGVPTQLFAVRPAAAFSNAGAARALVLHPARYPNRGTWRDPPFESVERDPGNFAAITLDRATGRAQVAGLPPGDMTGATIYGFALEPARRWHSNSARVAKADANGLALTDITSDGARPWLSDRLLGFVAGVPALLDSAGEWAVANGTLTLWAPACRAPAAVEAKVRERVLDVRHDHIEIVGIKFLGGAIDIAGSGNHLDRVEGRFQSGSLSWAPPLRSIASTAVRVTGHDDRITRSRFLYSAGELVTLGPAADRTRIEGNLFRFASYLGHFGNSLSVASSCNRILQNRFRDSGKEHVRLLPGARSNLVFGNDLSANGRVAHDVGAIVLWGVDGGGTRVVGNAIHDNVIGSASKLNHGIYFDNNNRDVAVYGNRIWNIAGNTIRLNSPQFNILITKNFLGASGKPLGADTYFNPNLRDLRSGQPVVDQLQSVIIADNVMATLPDFGKYAVRASGTLLGLQPKRILPAALSADTAHVRECR